MNIFFKKQNRKNLKDEKGQAMVEFALILPIFLLILCGILDMGWMFYNQLNLNNVCRDGARYAVVNTADDKSTDAIEDHIENYADTLPFTNDVDIKLVYSTPVYPTAGDITVTLTTKIKFLTPVLSTVLGSEKGLVSECVMKVES